MPPRITADVLEAFLHCRTKGHLKQAGQVGLRSDYEILAAEQRAAVRRQAIEQITARHADSEMISTVPLTASTLIQGAAFVLDTTLEDDTFSLRFDGLKKVDGPSMLGDFHYVPLLFHGGCAVGKEQRRLLDMCGMLLSRIQGRMPAHGIVWYGRECRVKKVRLSPDPRKAERLIRDLQQSQDDGPPRLVLNDHCMVCEFRQRCRDQAVREDALSLLRGLGEKEIKSYARKGILTLTQLAHTFRPRRQGKRAKRKTNPRYPALQALALRDKQVYLFGIPEVADAPVRIYLDIEGLPDERFVYLIGMTVVEGGSERHLAFWADTPDQEQEIFQQFLAEVSKHPAGRLYCYGSYEPTFLKRMRKAAARKGPVDRVLAGLVNVLSVVYAHAYFPCHSNGLKDVAGCLGGSWSDPDASGLQSIVWRKRWEAAHAVEWKQKLLTYNREDCAALRQVADFLHRVGSNPGGVSGSGAAVGDGPAVATVDEIDRLGTTKRRGKIDFFHPDFQFINGCAYFDYQRQRVYARTSKLLRKHRRKPGDRPNRKLRVSQRVQIVSRKCPSCGGSDVGRAEGGRIVAGRSARHKQAFDLVFTGGGIKRRVIECRSSTHRCNACGHVFVPDRYLRLAKHSHSLMSWAMCQHVARRISGNVLEGMFQEFFGLAVCQQEINAFKSLLAVYYRPCYRRLVKKILSGAVLHADETQVKLRGQTGYVWVFTTAEDVVYMYRPTREGNFLADLLTGFPGVLVSDFYAAYDAIPCPQQKCLIHLMRDMNQDLLNNPFDAELQSITGPFGVLLRAAVEAIDRHGLNHRHLVKLEPEVIRYFAWLAAQSFRSEAAEVLRSRLLKNRDKLFTFLRHDGVAWNNNNAENAIRQFAYYREEITGVLREGGLSDYLVLLSIYQTCRYRGVWWTPLSRPKNRRP
jgi:predicted RecB family nuclease